MTREDGATGGASGGSGTNGHGQTRRSVLRRTAATSVGVLGGGSALVGSQGTAAARSYFWKNGVVDTDAYDPANVDFGVDTEVGYLDRAQDTPLDGWTTHWFDMATVGAISQHDQKSSNTWTDFHHFTIDGCDDEMELFMDPDYIGLYPPDSSDVVQETFVELAGIAAGNVEDVVGYALDAIDAKEAIEDLFDHSDSCDVYKDHFEYQYLSTPNRSKHQAHFEIRHPSDQSGFVEVTSGVDGHYEGVDLVNLGATSDILLEVDSSGVTFHVADAI